MKKRTSIIVCLVVMLTMLTAFAAACSDKTFKINFYDGDKAYDTVTTGGNEVITLPTSPVKDGYTFAGWFFDDAMTNQLTENTYAELKLKAEVNVYAKWTANDNTIIFDANGGSGTMANFVAKTDSVILLTANAFTKDGYAFAGWATTADGAVVYADGASYTMTASGITLFAVWAGSDNTITFNANGGVGTIANQTIKTGASANLTANAFTKDGYAFAGWATTADGVVAYADGASYTMAVGGATLFAKWTANDNTITFYANFGTTDKSSQTIKTGESATLTLNAFVNAGYTFAGWATTASGTVVEFADGVNFTMGTANVELFAVWTAKDNTLSFNANGGVGTIANQTIKTGASANLTANTTITRDGYTFAGWATTAAGTVVEFADGVNYTMGTTNVELFAVWTANDNTITFNANGGVGTIANQTIKTGASANLTANTTITRDGYTFAGWATTAGGVVEFADGVNFTMGTTNVELFAVWTAKDNTLSFNANGGVGTIASQTIKTGESATLTLNAFVNAGYTFAGWATTASGTVVEFADGVNYTMGTTNVELFAVWTANNYTIKFNYNGAESDTTRTEITVVADAAFLCPAPTKTGYVFQGWYDGATQYTDNLGASVAPLTGANNAVYNVTAMWVGSTDRMTFTDDGTNATLTKYDGTAQYVVIPETYNGRPVTRIEGNAFSACRSLTSITIPASVTYIRPGAIIGCSAIESIFVDASNTAYSGEGNCLVENATKYLIAGCKNSVIPADVVTIGMSAFDSCMGLTAITIPASVETIAYGAFWDCRKLATVTFAPQSKLKTISDRAFCNCFALKAFTIPASVTSISGVSAYQPFLNAGIETFTVESGNIKYKVTGNCLIGIDAKIVIAGCKNSVIPTDDSVTQIGQGAFYEREGLTSLVIPSNVTKIGKEAINNCEDLVAVTLSEGLTEIGQSAFNHCPALTSITIPASVTTMGGYVFNNCRAITKITCLGKASKPAGWADNWLGNNKAKVEFKQA